MSDFNDMRLRIINNNPTVVRYVDIRPACWPYGEMIVSDGDADDTFKVTLGDLTIDVTARELLRLILMAARPDGSLSTRLFGILGLAKVSK